MQCTFANLFFPLCTKARQPVETYWPEDLPILASTMHPLVSFSILDTQSFANLEEVNTQMCDLLAKSSERLNSMSMSI